MDLALRLTTPALERMVNEADKLDLIDPETLRAELDARSRSATACATRPTPPQV